MKTSNSKNLTLIKMCCCSVAVQFGIQFFILAVHFDSFGVKQYGIAEIFLSKFIIALILEELCFC